MLTLVLLACAPAPECWISIPVCGDVADTPIGSCATCVLSENEGWIECSDGWSMDYGPGQIDGFGRSYAKIAEEARAHCEPPEQHP